MSQAVWAILCLVAGVALLVGWTVWDHCRNVWKEERDKWKAHQERERILHQLKSRRTGTSQRQDNWP